MPGSANGHKHLTGLIEIHFGVGVVGAVSLLVRRVAADGRVLGELPTQLPAALAARVGFAAEKK